MMQARLNDAAIELYQLLDKANIKHGIFGGYAIGALGGPRENKDIDCIASTSKEALVQLLDGNSGFQCIPQSRTDYVAFLWSDRADRGNAVLVEVFVEQFEGVSHSLGKTLLIRADARYRMPDLATRTLSVSGQLGASGVVSLLDPVYIFKGKLRAAATRGKFHDSADIRWLVSRFADELKAKRSEFNLDHVGLAIKRYPELELTFRTLDMDLVKVKERVASVELAQLPPPTRGDVQSGILG
ncbi:hypothetical protein AYL99_11016 [Fonsecaea erecta]|uniref:Uncharacterized protein n=1 Tax=Fonsecaea erecta TaxID=1367422 RepID=A0A178Z4A0_9EURO|nr:hypothetical protein AYL99_11016 [Fonsecaea erecta]OAP54568.1 hypothetical protein AYL99_11016 [Fonsecaea erecta]